MKMKLVKIVFAVILSLFAVGLLAQDKISVNYANQDVRLAIDQLCKGNKKDYTIERSVTGYVTLTLTDKSFEVVLTAICDQVYATYKYEDGIYKITSLRGTGMGTGMPGMGTGMPGMGTGMPGMGTGMPGMGTGMPGMGAMPGAGGINPSINVTQASVQNVEKIQLIYNHPAELLQMLNGSLYVDVAFSGSGSSSNGGSYSSGSSSNDSGNSRGSRNSNSSSSSSSSGSSSRIR